MISSQVAASSVPVVSERRLLLSDWCLLLLAPPMAWLALGIVLFNQDAFVDPWYYTGYGREFTLLHGLFGWRYYVVRFPVMMLNELFLSGSHPLIGYVVLRYLLILACGIPLYIWSRRELGRPAAAIGYLFLFCNPLLPRVLLWDLTTFISVPMALAAVATWHYSARFGWRMLSGFLMMMSVASHVFTGTALAAFLLVEVVRSARARELWRFVTRDLVATGCGAAACFAIGSLYYLARVGPFDPTLIVTVTTDAIGLGHEYAGSHSTPFSVWAAREYHIYVPVLCLAVAAALLGKRVFENTSVAAVWWFGVTYSSVYVVYQFVLGRFVLETFYYYAHLTVVVFLLVPVIVSEIARRVPRDSVSIAVAGVAALLLLPAVNNFVPSWGTPLDHFGYSNTKLLASLVVLSVVIVALSTRVRSNASSIATLCAFLLTAQAFTLLSPIHRRVFDSEHRGREQGVYLAAIQMLDVFAAYSKDGATVIPWHCPSQLSITAINSTLLLYSLTDPWKAGPCPLEVGDFERNQLVSSNPRYILLMNERADSFDAQERALRNAGYRVQPRLSKTIGNDDFQASLRVLELGFEAP